MQSRVETERDQPMRRDPKGTGRGAGGRGRGKDQVTPASRRIGPIRPKSDDGLAQLGERSEGRGASKPADSTNYRDERSKKGPGRGEPTDKGAGRGGALRLSGDGVRSTSSVRPDSGAVAPSAPQSVARSGGRSDDFDRLMHERFLFLIAHLVGRTVQVTVKSGV